MDETLTLEQARTIAVLLPTLMRKLAAPDDDLTTKQPLAQLRVCGILFGGPRPMSALSRELGVSLSALTQIADRLERARLVKRVACGGDRRVRHLELTERGESLMRLRESARIQRVLAALEHLSAEAREDVTAALQTLAGACAAADGQDVAHQTAQAPPSFP
jgi:DNA-binding MarR family transcriptional regulator